MNNTYINEKLNIECLNGELWKDIEGYEDLYAVSNMGRVINNKGVIKSQRNDVNGYKIVSLCKEGIKKNHKVHRLVAMAFIPNPDKKPMVNHKDEIKYHNRADNLEWCDAKYNRNYGTLNQRLSDLMKNNGHSKGVVSLNFNGELFHIFKSVTEAANYYNTSTTHISNSCLGKDQVAINGDFLLYEKDYNNKNYDINKLRNRRQQKPILQYDLNMNYIAEYPSVSQAKKILGINDGDICKVAKGKKKTAGGFIWKYKYEYE